MGSIKRPSSWLEGRGTLCYVVEGWLRAIRHYQSGHRVGKQEAAVTPVRGTGLTNRRRGEGESLQLEPTAAVEG